MIIAITTIIGWLLVLTINACVNAVLGFDPFDLTLPLNKLRTIRKIRQNIASDGLNPMWRTEKIGTISYSKKSGRGRLDVYVEVKNEVSGCWTNAFVVFEKVGDDWIGQFESLKTSQNMNDHFWDKENPSRRMAAIAKEERRDRRLKDLGII